MRNSIQGQQSVNETIDQREMNGPLSVVGQWLAYSGSSSGSFFLLTILGVLVYAPVFGHEFQTRWDDQWVAVNFYTEGGLSLENIRYILTEYYHGQYAPMNQLYYSSLYQLFGYDAFAFHTAGLVVHLLNSWLVFILIKKLLRMVRFTVLPFEVQPLLALLTAICFLIHPVSVESVAWISASKILLYALFYLLALLSYLRYIERPALTSYGLTLFLFILSFGGKEQAVTLPVCLFLLDYICGRNFSNARIYTEKIPFILLALFFGFVTMWSQSAVGAGALSAKAQYPLYQRFIFASFAFTEYLTKALLPVKLSYIYPFPNQIGEAVPSRFWMYPIICIGGLLASYRYLRNPWVLFWVLFFTVHIGVTLHIIPIARFAITADRYVYIAMLAPCFAVAYLFVYVITRGQRLKLWTTAASLLVYFVYMGTYSHHRATVWRNSETLKKEIKSIIKNRKDYDLLIKQKNQG